VTPDAASVRAALAGVIDPELDRSLVELDFVQSIEVDGDRVRVAIRLPTYWCSPNFAYLMVGDARAAVEAVPGVREARIDLVDHHAAEHVSASVAAGLSFGEAYPDVEDDDLGALRRIFRTKAFVVRQAEVLRAALAALGPDGALALTLGDGTPPAWAVAEEWGEYLGRRGDLGLPEGPAARVFTDARGGPYTPEDVPTLLRAARTVRISLESNTEFCTGLLAARYEGVAEWQRKEVAV
jgi:metal-sulfur cluster biosynthetic enzyme